MEPGTIEQYCQYVNAPWEVKKAAEKAHANAVTRHAPDMSDDDLVKIVKNCQKPSLQATLFLMLNTGCHAQDAKRLRRSQVEWYNDPDGRACIQVSWFWTKSIRKRKDRQGAVKYPFVMPPPLTFTASMKDGNQDRTPWSHTSMQVTNALEGKSTSLVFRRAADHRFEALSYSEERRAYLLTHQSVKMIRAHYSYKEPTTTPKAKMITKVEQTKRITRSK